MVAEEAQLPGFVQPGEPVQNEPPVQPRQHTHGQKEVLAASDPLGPIFRQAAARHDHVDMWVVGHRRAPGVEHGCDAHPCAEVLGVGGNPDHRVCARPHQEIVDLPFVLVGDVRDRFGQREDQVEIPHGQQFGLARRQPSPGCPGLAFGTVAIATGIVGDVLMGAVFAPRDMAAERRRAAALDSAHDLQLIEADVADVGRQPGSAVGAEDIRNLQRWPRQRGLRRAFLALLALGRPQVIQRAVHCRDHARGNARISSRRGQFGMAEQCLNDPDVHTTFQQMCREGMAQRVQRNRFGDARHPRRLLEQSRDLAGREMFAAIAGEENPLGARHACILAGGAFGPPFAQQAQNICGQHHVAILAALGLHDADDVLGAIDVANAQPDNFARTHPAAIGKRQHHARLKARCHGQDAFNLIAAQDKRYLHRLLEAENLGHKIVPSQGDPEQKLHPGHRAIARADAGAGLNQMLLEIADVIWLRCLWRTPKPGRKPLARPQVSDLRCRS